MQWWKHVFICEPAVLDDQKVITKRGIWFRLPVSQETRVSDAGRQQVDAVKLPITSLLLLARAMQVHHSFDYRIR